MDIKELNGKKAKISKSSITCKDDNGKTCGVVRNIVNLYDLQANKQMDYYRRLKDSGIHGKVDIKDIIISDGEMYIFRNIKSKMFHETYGYFDEEEKQTALEKDSFYRAITEKGFNVIEYIPA